MDASARDPIACPMQSTMSANGWAPNCSLMTSGSMGTGTSVLTYGEGSGKLAGRRRSCAFFLAPRVVYVTSLEAVGKAGEARMKKKEKKNYCNLTAWAALGGDCQESHCSLRLQQGNQLPSYPGLQFGRRKDSVHLGG